MVVDEKGSMSSRQHRLALSSATSSLSTVPDEPERPSSTSSQHIRPLTSHRSAARPAVSTSDTAPRTDGPPDPPSSPFDAASRPEDVAVVDVGKSVSASVCHRYRDTATYWLKSQIFPTPVLFTALDPGDPFEFLEKLYGS